MKKRFLAVLLGCAVMNLLNIEEGEPQGGTPAPILAEGEEAPAIQEPGQAEPNADAAPIEEAIEEGNEGADVVEEDDAA